MIDRPARAMVVTAHPDDEIGCAGTVALWTGEGSEVAFVVCTNGNKGTEDPEMTPERLAKIREEEQRNACRELGVEDVVFLGYPDGELEDTRQLRMEIVREIRRFRPEVVFTHSPLNSLRHTHRDHRMCGTATLDAIFPYARDPLHFAELTQQGFQPHKVGTALLWSSSTPNEYVDISRTVEQKRQAMLQHRSQFVDRRSRDPNTEPAWFVVEGAKRLGEQAGMEYAEAFHKLTFRS